MLAPLAALYGAAAARRMARDAPRAALPTVVIGGPTAGGDGKTPLALALAAILKRMGETPAFLTRGYRRKREADAPFLVDLSRHDAEAAGDEALLLARVAPTVVASDRAAGAQLARELGASLLILDDGLHSRRLAPDLALGVVDSHYGLGNGLCLPAGPLRAPPGDFFGYIDALVIVGDGARADPAECAKPKFFAALAPEDEDVARLRGKRAFAFAGIARADKFERSLRNAGVEVVAMRRFADHHPFSQAELGKAARAAGEMGATLVTTRKDATRISMRDINRFGIEAFATRLQLCEETTMADLLSKAISRARPRRGA